MLVRFWFERKRRHFLEKKTFFLKMAREYELSGNVQEAKRIYNAVENLQTKSDLIALHFAGGGHCLQNGIIFKVYSFWNDYSTLDDSLKSIFRQIIETIVFVGGTVFLVKRFWFGFYTVPSGSAEPNLLVGDRICGVKYPYLFSSPARGDLIIIDDPLFKYSKNPFQKLYQKYIGLPLFGLLEKGPESWTKRVIGLPGDRVSIKPGPSGMPSEIYVNGSKLHEPYRNPYPVIMLDRKSGILSKNNSLFKLPLIGPLLDSILAERHIFMRYTYDPDKPYNEQPFYNFTEDEVYRNPVTGRPFVLYPNQIDPKLDIIPEFIVPKGHMFLVGDNRKNSRDCRELGVFSMSFLLGRCSFIFWSLDSTENWWITEFVKHPVEFFTKKLRWSRFFRFVHPFKELPKS